MQKKSSLPTLLNPLLPSALPQLLGQGATRPKGASMGQAQRELLTEVALSVVKTTQETGTLGSRQSCKADGGGDSVRRAL